MNKLKDLYRHFFSHPEGSWIMAWENAQLLYDFIRKHDIKRVLDLGTGIGCSVSFAALALQDKKVDYHIDSVEQFDKCIRLANELIPPEFKEHITIHKANAMIWQDEKVPYQNFSIYDKLPEGDYDLIINDGPSPWGEGEQYIELPNATVTKMMLEGKLKPGTFVVWDGRMTAFKALERYYGDNFFLAFPAPGRTDFNVIEKKDCPLAFYDMKHRYMTEAGFFKDPAQPAA